MKPKNLSLKVRKIKKMRVKCELMRCWYKFNKRNINNA